MGSRAPQRQRLVVLTSVMARRECTNPHTSEYVRFHQAARCKASHFVAACASTPHRASTENMRGVKERWQARDASTYLSFFAFSVLEALESVLPLARTPNWYRFCLTHTPRNSNDPVSLHITFTVWPQSTEAERPAVPVHERQKAL